MKKVGWKRIKKEAMQSLFDEFLWKLEESLLFGSVRAVPYSAESNILQVRHVLTFKKKRQWKII